MKPLIQRIIMGAVATVALAFAAGVCVVSAAYGLYALLRISLSAAASAGLTALAAAILVAILAFVLTRLRGAGKPAGKAGRIDSETLQTAAAVGTAIAGMAADFALQHRAERKHSKRAKRGWRRR